MNFYSILKNYRNLENHKLKGIVQSFETIEFKRFFILTFYSLNWKKLYGLNNELKYHYCPIMQETLSFEPLLKENFFTIPTKKQFLELREKNNYSLSLSNRRIFQKLIMDKNLFLKLNNFSINFEKHLWKRFLSKTLVEDYLKLYKKFFSPFKNKKLNLNLKNKKILFSNSIIRFQIYNQNNLKNKYSNLFYKKWIQILFKLNILSILFFKNLKFFNLKNNLLFFPVQLYIRFSKKLEIKKMFFKIFFFKNFFFKISTQTWYWTLLKNIKNSIKNKKIKLQFYYNKIFIFNRLIQFLFLKLFLLNLKFKFNKVWKLYLRLNLQINSKK